jgi:hypothetical protein
MKRFQLFSLASAMLLASAAGFTSCSSDSEDPLDGGSGVAGQVVKTQFYLNIPYAGNDEGGNARVSTRMTATNTQNNKNFLGLQDMQMYAFDGEATGITSTSTSTKTIKLGTSGNAPSKDDISTSTTSWRSIYRDIEIPLGTKSLILYAKASRTTTGSSNEKNNFQAGKLTNPYETANDKTTLSNLNFSLNQIYKTDNFTSDGSVILEALNTVAKTKITTTSESELEWANVGQSTIGTENERTALQNRYNNFVKATAGSANSVRLLITDLKNVIKGNKLEDDQVMAKTIVDNCDKALGKLISKTFPGDFNLPDGVAQVSWDDKNKTFNFVSAASVNIGETVVGTGNNINFTEITYPAELAYFVSSPVKTSENEITAASKLPNYNEWVSGTSKWEGYEDEVKHRTRFVALKEPLQYGVACLQSKVSCKTTALADNAQQFGFKTDNTISVNGTENFTVTGILVGGQPFSVAWDFEPANVKTNDFKYTVYDQNVDYGKNNIATGTSNNYTLVFDNKDAKTKSKVYVTIELENNVENFYGAEGLIPKGSKFYLVGELDPNNTAIATQPSTGETIDHVFVKDHTTIANFTITNLKKAYNHIPDMRTSKINVGLAVDLSWQKGITFNVEL